MRACRQGSRRRSAHSNATRRVTGPSTLRPMRDCRSVELNDPVVAPAELTKFGFSSQLASPLLKKVLATMDPVSFTGSRDADSTFTCACSATCSCNIATTGSGSCAGGPAVALADGAGADPLPCTMAFNACTSARSASTCARNSETSCAVGARSCARAVAGTTDANAVNTEAIAETRMEAGN